jgi:hypothetical protein
MIAEVTNHIWQSTLFAAAAGLLTLPQEPRPSSLLVVVQRIA